MLLNNQHITEEIKKEIKIYIETNDNENMTIQNLLNAVKAMLRGTFIVIKPTSRNKRNNKKPNLTPKATRKRRTKVPQS